MTEPRDILEAVFVGDDVDGAEIARAANTAREDADLRALFDQLALADREVRGDFEARVGEAWFLDSLDTMLAEEEEQAHAEKVVSLDSRRPRFAPVLLAAAAAVAVAFGLVANRSDQPAPEFQPRSAKALNAATYESPAVEVFCVKRTASGVEFVGAEQAELATVRCSRDQEIKLAVRNPDDRLRYAAFVGVSQDHELHWYGPSPAAPAAVAVPANSELSPIGETIRLDVNHEPGTVRLVGVFAEEPLEFSELKRWAEGNAAGLWDGQVDVPAGVMVRQTFEVTQ